MKKMIVKNRFGNFCLQLLWILLITIFIECFIYNFRYWESLFFHEITDYDVNLYGLESIDDYFYKITNNEYACIEITNINSPVKNVYFNPFAENDDFYNAVEIILGITDDANALPFNLRQTEVVNGIIESQYIRIFLVGKSETIKIQLPNCGLDKFVLDFGLNEVRPFVFHSYRFLIIFVLVFVIWFLNPKSKLYLTKIDLNIRWQKIAAIIAVLINMALYAAILFLFRDPNWKSTSWLADLQYNYMAESLSQGKVYLDITPPNSLSSMDNPYDTVLRNRLVEQNGETYIIDFAYFDGRYYSYFGVVPVLFFYLPYYMITGEWLETAQLLLLLSLIFCCAVFWFVYTIIKRFFKNTSLGLFFLLNCVLIAGSEITYCVQNSTLYSVPIMMGVLLDITGITCWFHAVKNDHYVDKIWLIAGSICIALVLGCRPQLTIAVLFAFPIFEKQIKKGLFFSGKGLKNTMCLCIPFLLICIFFMYYNYIRFKNPFDFGATYNLTTFDMTHRGFIFERFILGFFEYLFQPFRMNARFPYFDTAASRHSVETDYQGYIFNEPIMGGFFAINLIALVNLFTGIYKTKLKNKCLYSFILMSLSFALIIIAVDVQMVGITQRYFTDFSLFFMITTIILTLTIFEDNQNCPQLWLEIITFFSALCLLTNFIILIGNNGRSNNLWFAHRNYYYRIKYDLFSIFSIR